MSNRFVKLEEDTWTDRKFLALSTDARLLFIWSWSLPHAALCGLYRATLRDLGDALGAHDSDSQQGRLGRVRRALDELDQAGMVKHDATTQVLWVVNRVKHQYLTPKSISVMQREVRNCPDSPLVDEFLQRYGRVLGMKRHR